MQIDLLPDYSYEGKQTFLRYELNMIATSDREAGEKCQVDLDMDKKGSKWTKIIDHAEKIKQVQCDKGRCANINLGGGSLDGTGLYKGVLLKIPRDQDIYGVSNIDIKIKLIEQDTLLNISNLQMIFAIVTLTVLFVFWKRVS